MSFKEAASRNLMLQLENLRADIEYSKRELTKLIDSGMDVGTGTQVHAKRNKLKRMIRECVLDRNRVTELIRKFSADVYLASHFPALLSVETDPTLSRKYAQLYYTELVVLEGFQIQLTVQAEKCNIDVDKEIISLRNKNVEV